MVSRGWVGFDFDGSLAKYVEGQGNELGEPLQSLLAVLRDLLEQGVECRIVTARVSSKQTVEERLRQRGLISEWLHKHVGEGLAITAEKDYGMLLLYDDRAVTVEHNTGRPTGVSTCPL